MTCIVLDDEELSIRHLVNNYIQKIPYLEVVATFSDPQEALIFLQGNRVDLVFLDIEMPNHPIDGIHFMKIMRPDQWYILTTGHPQYALESYNYNVVDYLRKPFSFERFVKALQKAQHLIENTENLAINPVIFVKSEGKLKAIALADICWIESFRNSITINTEANRFTSSLTITDIEKQLPPTLFTRVHKSFIIANSHIDVIDKDTVSIRCSKLLKAIPIGDLYRKNFSQVIDNRIIKKSTK